MLDCEVVIAINVQLQPVAMAICIKSQLMIIDIATSPLNQSLNIAIQMHVNLFR